MASEEYFDKPTRDSFKPQLLAYLRAKAARRSEATSPEAMKAAESEFVKDRAYQEGGALLGALSSAQSMAGTLGGKRSEASIIPTFMGAERNAAQGMYDNELKLRGLEENSLRTDLDVAKTIAEGDADNDKRKMEKRRLDITENQGLSRNDLMKQQLYQNLEEKRQERALESGRLGETTRHNKAMEGLYGKGRGPGGAAADKPYNWTTQMGTDADGNPMAVQIDPRNGKARAVPLPKGFKSKDELNAERKAEAAQAKADAPRKMTPHDIENFGQARDAVAAMDLLEKELEKYKDKMGPVQGRLNSWNPYDTDAQTFDAALRAKAQKIGKYLEGGVLRKEDEEKYRHMLPTMADTPAVAQNKLQEIRQMLRDKQAADLNALQTQGYSTEGLGNSPRPMEVGPISPNAYTPGATPTPAGSNADLPVGTTKKFPDGKTRKKVAPGKWQEVSP